MSSLSGSFASKLIRVAAGSLTSLEMFAVQLGLKGTQSFMKILAIIPLEASSTLVPKVLFQRYLNCLL